MSSHWEPSCLTSIQQFSPEDTPYCDQILIGYKNGYMTSTIYTRKNATVEVKEENYCKKVHSERILGCCYVKYYNLILTWSRRELIFNDMKMNRVQILCIRDIVGIQDKDQSIYVFTKSGNCRRVQLDENQNLKNSNFRLRPKRFHIRFFLRGSQLCNRSCFILWNDSMFSSYYVTSENCSKVQEKICDWSYKSNGIQMIESSPDDYIVMVNGGINEKRTFTSSEDANKKDEWENEENDEYYSKVNDKTVNRYDSSEKNSNDCSESKQVIKYLHNLDYYNLETTGSSFPVPMYTGELLLDYDTILQINFSERRLQSMALTRKQLSTFYLEPKTQKIVTPPHIGINEQLNFSQLFSTSQNLF